MPEIGTSGLMSGDGKRGDGHKAPSYRAHPRLYRNGRSAPRRRMNLGFSGRRACDNLLAQSANDQAVRHSPRRNWSPTVVTAIATARKAPREMAMVADPSKFAHVVFNTHRYEEMIDWYKRVFEARVQHRDDRLAFLTYDDEHHRFAFVNLGPTKDSAGERPATGAGVCRRRG